MKFSHLFLSLTLLLSSLIFTSLSSGATPPSSKPAPSPKIAAKEPDLGSFYDGKLKWSAQERLRLEYRENNFDFDSSNNAVTDDVFVLQRFRVGLTALPANGVKITLEGQDSREFDSKRPNIPGVLGSEGDDEFDFRQAWILMGDKSVSPLSLKIGRMPWKYGDERLVGDFDWNNLGRTFDGAVIHTELPQAWIDLFFGSPTYVKPRELNTNDGQDRLRGAYYSTTQWLNQTTEFYAFYRNHQNAVNNGQAQETLTPGLRVKSLAEKYGNWDYELEIAGQEGKVQTGALSLDHHAFASHIQGTYTWRDCSHQPFVSLFYDYGSGDENPGDSEDTGFQNLFPTNHKFYGSMDLFSWRNIHDFGTTFAIKPTPKTLAKIDIHSFWLPETADAWYRANGATTIRSSAAGRNVDNHVGEEIDLTLNWTVHRFATIGAGYSHFFTGGFVSATGKSSDADFAYLMLTSSF